MDDASIFTGRPAGGAPRAGVTTIIMAKQRIVNTRFWDDSYIARLSPNEKLLFLYLLTSPLTTIAGVYELPLKRVVFDTGLSTKEITAMFSKLETDGKLVRHQDWVGIVNFVKHQSLNPKVRQGIIAEMERVPRELIEHLPVWPATLAIGFDRLSHPNSNPNINPNPNLNSNADSQERTPQSNSKDLGQGIQELVKKMRLRP